jgi:molybdopterin-guanine dinucleotide biosynthesis protein A
VTGGRERAGIVLAGGESTRFGSRDKALAELDGRPLVAHVAESLSAVTDRVVVSCRPGRTTPLRRALADVADATYVTDPVADCGPVVGLATALEAVSAPYVAVVACDNPLVSGTFLDHLFERARGRDGAVPRLGGTVNPVQAVYRTEPTRRACRAVATGDGALRSVVARLDVVELTPEGVRAHTSPRTLTDVNTPADLAALPRD